MGKKRGFKKRSKASYKRSQGTREFKTGEKRRLIAISLKNFDRNQGQDFEEWQKNELLALAINKLQGVCTKTRLEAIAEGIIKEYPKGNFPPNSDFYHPQHIEPDIAWCSFHIQGKECIIGFFDDNIFHIVFLDMNHRFWITQKKNT